MDIILVGKSVCYVIYIYSYRYNDHILVVSKQLGLPVARNPALPASAPTFEASTLATGPNRNYLTVRSHPPNVAYPPRPVPGSIADLDMIMRRCDYTANKVSNFIDLPANPSN